MKDSTVSFLRRDTAYTGQFRAGVCLHGHTMHSEECLSFLPRYLHHVPGVSQILSGYQRGPQPAVDFSKAYWTPPLSPASALQLEREQIASLGLHPFVSLTDHDNIEAGVSIQAAAGSGDVPISLEWTVPFGHSIFHLGIHNLPPDAAQYWMCAMATYSATRNGYLLREILSTYAGIPGVLVVLNHPFWLEVGIAEIDHRLAIVQFLSQYAPWLHAFELNGTRRWSENAAVMELARVYSRPTVSGGDRHACEPAACLNLTSAPSFSEFAEEVRAGHSSVVFMPQYQEPMALRVLEACCEILRPYPEYAGRERWIDRVFYRSEYGPARTLAALWEGREPWLTRPVSGAFQFIATTRVRMVLRVLMARQAEIS